MKKLEPRQKQKETTSCTLHSKGKGKVELRQIEYEKRRRNNKRDNFCSTFKFRKIFVQVFVDVRNNTNS